jgi:hypothetical protein
MSVNDIKLEFGSSKVLARNNLNSRFQQLTPDGLAAAGWVELAHLFQFPTISDPCLSSFILSVSSPPLVLPQQWMQRSSWQIGRWTEQQHIEQQPMAVMNRLYQSEGCWR